MRTYLKYLIVVVLSLGLNSCANKITPQHQVGNAAHKKDILSQKIFYFLYQVEHSPKMRNELLNNTVLKEVSHQTGNALLKGLESCPDLACLADSLLISKDENTKIINALSELYHHHSSMDAFIKKKIRPTHFYILNKSLSDSALFIETWKEEKDGINYIVNAYLKNKGVHHPAIDSASFNVRSKGYYDSIKALVQKVLNGNDKNELFFQPMLNISLAILQLNGRDEAARFIPLQKVNQKAYNRVSKIKWDQYAYTSILIFGEGPMDPEVPISPANKERCAMGAVLFREKKAPFIIVSGGYVHPFRTKYCEAQEMKIYLTDSLHIPEDAIMMEPHARHTTTNVRNANRIIYNQHIPASMPVLGVTSKSHIDYIVAKRFKSGCMKEMGYLPFEELKRISETEVEFYPSMLSLQINAVTPLDP